MRGGVPPTDEVFLVFYETYVLTVLRVLGRVGVRTAEVPDIAQHVFLKVYKNFDKIPAKHVDAWVDMICVQQAAEYYRLYRNRFETPEPHVGEDILDDVDLEQQFERCEVEFIVKQVLARMDAKLREVLVRHEFHDESLETIAEALGIARNTAQSRLAEAKRIFRLRISKILGDNRKGTPLLLPFGASTLCDTDLQSPAFVERVRRQVWQSLAHELGLDETPRARPSTSAVSHSEPPASRREAKQLLRRIAGSGFIFGMGGVAGFIAAFLWPHETPIDAKHLSMMIPVINVQNHEAMQSPIKSDTIAPPVVASISHTVRVMAPEIDRETQALERARELIASGRYSEALAELARHEKQFPQSQHAEARNRYVALARERQARAPAEAPKVP